MGRLSTSLTVPSELAGTRLDKVIAALLEVSRSEARRLFDQGSIKDQSGAPLVPSSRLSAGEQVEIDAPERPDGVEAEPVEFGVLYEDTEIAVIDKPAGTVVHPGAGARRTTLVSGLLHRWPALQGVGETPRWGIVHRLDRDTSGAMVVALTEAAYSSLQTEIREHRVTRQYLALVHGSFGAPTGTVDAPIERHPTQPTRRRAASGGRPSVTDYTVVAFWSASQLALVEVRLRTGRTHQIRVHMESIGHHVVGDPVYGRPAAQGIDPGRVWLHAQTLGFAHPGTGEEILVEAPLPADLVASLEALGEPDLGGVGLDG